MATRSETRGERGLGVHELHKKRGHTKKLFSRAPPKKCRKHSYNYKNAGVRPHITGGVYRTPMEAEVS